MYKSPIEIAVNNMVTQMEHDREQVVMRCIHKEGINVDKEELIRALNHERNQYRKGYLDGKNDTLDKIRAEIIEMRSKKNVGVLECMDIIDKYRNGDANFDCKEKENDEIGKIQVAVEINNMAELTQGHWWVVVRYIDGRLWYYGAYESEKRASYVAEELKNTLVVEIEKP